MPFADGSTEVLTVLDRCRKGAVVHAGQPPSAAAVHVDGVPDDMSWHESQETIEGSGRGRSHLSAAAIRKVWCSLGPWPMLLGLGRRRHRPTPGPRGRWPDGTWRRGRELARCLVRVQATLAVGYCMRRSPALERLRPLRQRPRALCEGLETNTKSGRQQRGPALGTSDWSKKS